MSTLTVLSTKSKEYQKTRTEALIATLAASSQAEQAILGGLCERTMHSVAAHNPGTKHHNLGLVGELEILCAIGLLADRIEEGHDERG